jgi:hypothetical protein
MYRYPYPYLYPCTALHRDKLGRLKAQKRVLVGELRGLRDLGLYEGRITVDHAQPSEAPTPAPGQPDRDWDWDRDRDWDSPLGPAPAGSSAGSSRGGSPVLDAKGRAEEMNMSDKTTPKANGRDGAASALQQEKGINFSVLKVSCAAAACACACCAADPV